MTDPEVPKEVIVGKVDHEWPVHVFISDAHAISWVNGAARGPCGQRRRLWKATIELGDEMTVETPPPKLVKKGDKP